MSIKAPIVMSAIQSLSFQLIWYFGKNLKVINKETNAVNVIRNKPVKNTICSPAHTLLTPNALFVAYGAVIFAV